MAKSTLVDNVVCFFYSFVRSHSTSLVMNNRGPTKVEVIIDQFKNHKILSALLLLGIIVIALGTFFDALTKIGTFVAELSGTNTPAATQPNEPVRNVPYRPPKSVSGESFEKLLFQASHELRRNREYLEDVRGYLKNTGRQLPIGSLRTENTLELLGGHYQRATKAAYGEEKYIYQLILKLDDVAATFYGFRTREDFGRWNKTYEMTVDDVSFLCGFLAWYMSGVAREQLSPKLFDQPGRDPPSTEFASADEVVKLNMQFFVHQGKPITDYSLFLGLID